jgi:hypothetical protein
MKMLKYMALVSLVFAAAAVLAQTNAVPALPGLTPEGTVDVVSLINLSILALTPLVTQGFKKLIPKLPPFTLNLLAPLLGAAIGAALHALGVSVATGWGAAIWGGLGTWLYELSSNVKDALAGGSAPTPPTT